MNYKVLITTSGTGSRLGELTDFTNKSLIRLGDRPSISHIVEAYHVDTKFVVTLGHYGEHVRQFLEISYPNIDFEFIEVDNYTGVGSSLLYSILQAKQVLQCPFIFNACDTVFDENSFLLESFEDNFCIGSPLEDSTQYTTLMIKNKEVIKINQKGELNYDAAYVGVCGIKDYKLFWQKLEKVYKENKNNSTLFEGNVINEMIKSVNFQFINTTKWFDVGNVGELEKTRKYFTSSAEVLEKKEESIYFFENHIVKFFHNSQLVSNRIVRSEKLNGIVPKIVDFKKNFYKYEKVQGDLLSKVVSVESFCKLLHWAEQNLWKRNNTQKIEDLCHVFYVDKTIKRINKFVDKYGDSKQTINGLVVPKAIELLQKIDKEWLCDGVASQFHGDFILDNILETKNGFCLLDWRQDFAGSLEVGDIYYDLAKLNHNLTVNHEIVNKQLFSDSESNCHILCNSILLECKVKLKEFIKENDLDYKKVELLTSLVWINMSPLHAYPFDKFLFNFGKYNLARCLDE